MATNGVFIRRMGQVFTVGTTVLCLLMLVWSLAAPASWKAGFWPELGDKIQKDFGAPDPSKGPTPTDGFSKYKGQRAVVLLHQLPGALWAVAIPLQLSTKLRRSQPRLHRFIGMVVGATTLALTGGVVVMDMQAMLCKSKPQWMHRHLPATTVHGNLLQKVLLDQHVKSAWFLFCWVMAWRTAVKGQIQKHSRWISRYIATGMSIAVMRFVTMPAYMAAAALGWVSWDTEEARGAAFNENMVISGAMCVLGTELWLLYKKHAAAAARTSAAEESAAGKASKFKLMKEA